jgi:hypothetical protein
LRIVKEVDPTQDFVEGTKVFENIGSLPYVPNFPVEVTVSYRVWKNDRPPTNKKTR